MSPGRLPSNIARRVTRKSPAFPEPQVRPCWVLQPCADPLREPNSRSTPNPSPMQILNSLNPFSNFYPSEGRGATLRPQRPFFIRHLGLCRLRLGRLGRRRVVRFYQRHIYQMLRQEPNLQLLGPDDVADQEVVRPVVPALG